MTTGLTVINVITLAAGSSVLASVVTQGLNEWRDRIKNKRESAFSSLYLALALEAYASECSTVISESENYEASDESAGSPQGNIPTLGEYPSSVDWKSLGIAPTTDAMSFQVEVETTRAMIRGSWEYGDEEDIVPQVREEAARLGLKALTLASTFRREAKVAAVQFHGDWNLKAHLEDRAEHYVERRKRREASNRAMIERLNSGMAGPPAAIMDEAALEDTPKRL